MALSVPTTQELSDDIIAQLEASISQTIPLLPKAFSRVLAKVLAGALVLVYRYAGFIFLQLFVAHASFRETTVLGVTLRPLVEWGKLIGVGEPTAATRAELIIDVTVTEQTGNLPAGEQLLRTETGVIYVTKAPVALNAATVQATVIASSDPDDNGGAGSIGNLTAGDIVSFASPLDNVGRDATVSSVSVTGADGDTETSYRNKVIARWQARPQGGAYADYRVWATSVAGIINAYPYTSSTPGEVDVYVEATVASSGSADGIPTAGQLSDVADAIELDVAGLATRRPANAAVNVVAITRTGLGVEVVGLTIDATQETAVKSEIETGLDEFMRSREPFITGLSVLPREDRITVAEVGGVVHGIVNARGGSITSVTLLNGVVETALYQLGDGEKAKLDTPVTYS